MTNEEACELPDGLDEADLDEIRSLAVEALAEMGKRTVQIGPRALVTEDGLHLFLANLARDCAASDRSQWPALVVHYARAVTIGSVLEATDLPDEEFLAQVRARVLPPDWTPGFATNHTYARALAADQPETSPVVALCLDLPDSVITLSDRQLVGRDLEAVWTAGLANTMAEPVDEHQRLAMTIGEGEEAEYLEGLDYLEGSSFYLASKILDIPALIGDRDLSGGALFAIPRRHTILLHLPRTRREAENALQVIASLAQDWTDTAGSVSPEVFSWKDGVYHQVTKRNETGGYRSDFAGPFFTALS